MGQRRATAEAQVVDSLHPDWWNPRSYQLRFLAAMQAGCKRAALVWHRRAGKDRTCLAWCSEAMADRVGIYYHLFPTHKQGRKIIWQGKDREGRPFLDIIRPERITRRLEDDMLLQLDNGSAYQVVGVDNIDRIVGTNPVGLIYSEWALMDPRAWALMRPVLRENGGWAVFPYTPRGKNHGHTLFKMAENNPWWLADLRTVEDTRDHEGRRIITEDDIAQERAEGMAEDLVLQEYFCSWAAGVEGAYYGRDIEELEREGRFTRVPWDPAATVETAWDIGIGDSTAIWFFQVVGPEVHVLDYMEANGKGVGAWARDLQQLAWERKWVFGCHWGPHDVAKREFGTGQPIAVTAAKAGLPFQVVPRPGSVQDGIELVRTVLPRCWFNTEGPGMERGRACLENYRREWDEKLQVYKNLPLHDWTSHGADAFRTLAYALNMGAGRYSADDMTPERAAALREQYSRPPQ